MAATSGQKEDGSHGRRCVPLRERRQQVRWLKIILATAVTALATTLSLGAPAIAATTTTASVYSFDLTTPNTALSPDGGTMAAPGDSISVTGSGTFNPAAKTVRAKGTFVHYRSDGTVMSQRTWKATGFTGFTDFGTDGQGQEGACCRSRSPTTARRWE
jgi:hypothetical protein